VNTNDPHNDAEDVETLLHRTLTMRDTAWEAARVRFVSRAASSGLVDVGYEVHETRGSRRRPSRAGRPLFATNLAHQRQYRDGAAAGGDPRAFLDAFALTGPDGRLYLSERPGTVGGHRGSKLYGRLDCRAALQAIERGGYVRHRVFFADEPTAKAAGYRPCAVCMPQQHAAWKAS
jgi:hypothetical protein